MQERPQQRIHRIQILRPPDNPSDPDRSASGEAVIATCFAERRDLRAREVGPDGDSYFRTQVLYTVARSIEAKLRRGPSRSAGMSAAGSLPAGADSVQSSARIGVAAETDDIVYDQGRRKRYKIVGSTLLEAEDNPLRMLLLYTEETS